MHRNGIKVGTVMIRAGTLMPDNVEVEAEPFGRGWAMIKGLDGALLDKMIRTAGWSFFFLAENIGATVHGSGGVRASRRAVMRLLGQVKASSFNCLEITEISPKRFLGIPYVRVSAHSRHIQQGQRLRSFAERSRTEADTTWAIG